MRPLKCVTDSTVVLPPRTSPENLSDHGLKASHFVRHREDQAYVLNAWDLRSGDIILYEGTGASGALITSFQREVDAGSNAEWSHVSIYSGDGQVWESLFPGGVQNRGFNTSTHKRTIAVRRYTGNIEDFEYELDQALIEEVGTPYGHRAIRSLVAGLGRRYFGSPVPRDASDPALDTSITHAAICSQLIKRLYFQVLGVNLMPGKTMLPKDFADSSDFSDIELKWYHYDPN